MNKDNLTKKASKKIIDGAKTPEGISAIGGAATGGFLGGTVGIVGSFAGITIGGITGVLPVAAIGAGAGYAVTKIIRNRNKIKKLEKEVENLKTQSEDKKDAEF
mgnify:CR=1 FL=1